MKHSSPVFCSFILLILCQTAVLPADENHTFALGTNAFLLDNQPFQIISGELHPARIPHQYWRHRIQMTRAMGCNAVAVYLFWNFHEPRENEFDFTSPQCDVAAFIRLAAEEKMWVLIRPGPYVCGEWDFGGLPPYLLRHPDIKVRCRDARYMAAVKRYIDRLADLIRPYQITRGGPILMLQIENEYGSYGNDREYLSELADSWRKNGIDIPFYTADGPTPHMLDAGSLEGAAVGLDSGSCAADFELAEKIRPGVPVFSSETYPGWLTHWGEKWARPDPLDLFREVRYLLENHKSVNFYVIHGGTNFGFTAGANSGGKGYEPDITSYDYDAPIDEQGLPTAKYHALRKLIAPHLPKDRKMPSIPNPIPSMDIPPITMSRFSPLLFQCGEPIPDIQPRPMEMYGQTQGMILYRTRLIGRKSGKLQITNPHDFVLVYLDGQFIGTIDRRLGENTIELPVTNSVNPMLDLLVEAMGRINFAQAMIDRKGITDRVTLSGMTLMNWQVYPLPLDQTHLNRLTYSADPSIHGPFFFSGSFTLKKTADTFMDLSQWQKGMVWVNGHNLGRYWNIGPQQRLYCPGTFLKKGKNEILILDMLQMEPTRVSGKIRME